MCHSSMISGGRTQHTRVSERVHIGNRVGCTVKSRSPSEVEGYEGFTPVTSLGVDLYVHGRR